MDLSGDWAISKDKLRGFYGAGREVLILKRKEKTYDTYVLLCEDGDEGEAYHAVFGALEDAIAFGKRLLGLHDLYLESKRSRPARRITYKDFYGALDNSNKAT